MGVIQLTPRFEKMTDLPSDTGPPQLNFDDIPSDTGPPQLDLDDLEGSQPMPDDLILDEINFGESDATYGDIPGEPSISPYHRNNLLEGDYVEYKAVAGWWFLGFLIAFVGCFAALEILSRRTSRFGKRNVLRLIGVCVSYGGIAILGNHYLSEFGLEMGYGESHLRFSYNTWKTMIALVFPVVGLLPAYLIVGAEERPRWIQLILGGMVIGGVQAGAHYISEHAIQNYTMVHNMYYRGATFALSALGNIMILWMMFGLRRIFYQRWWKNLFLGTANAGIVVATHWCAMLGTWHEYRPVEHQHVFPKAVAYIISALSFIGFIAVIAIAIRGRAHHLNVKKRMVREILLTSATFSEDGRIMVEANGELPGVTICHNIQDKSLEDQLHPRASMFQWMYRVSRDWVSVENILDPMDYHHKALLAKDDFRLDQLDDKEMSYYFREKFVFAAEALSQKLGQKLEQLGVLYEDIYHTGFGLRYTDKLRKLQTFEAQLRFTEDETGRGRMLILSRMVDEKEESRLRRSGYRFTDINEAAHVFEWSTQTPRSSVMSYMHAVREFCLTTPVQLPPAGIYLGLMALRPTVINVALKRPGGFEAFTSSHVRSRIPMQRLNLNSLRAGDVELLKQFDNKPLREVLYGMMSIYDSSSSPKPFKIFIRAFVQAVRLLTCELNDTWVLDSIFMSDRIMIPCRDTTARGGIGLAALFPCRIILPVHEQQDKKCGYNYEFLPIKLLSEMQRVYRHERYTFQRNVMSEFIKLAQETKCEIEREEAERLEYSQRAAHKTRKFSTTSSDSISGWASTISRWASPSRSDGGTGANNRADRADAPLISEEPIKEDPTWIDAIIKVASIAACSRTTAGVATRLAQFGSVVPAQKPTKAGSGSGSRSG